MGRRSRNRICPSGDRREPGRLLRSSWCSQSNRGRAGKLAWIFSVSEASRSGAYPLLVSDKRLGLLDALYEYYLDARWQRGTVHFYRNVQRVTPRGKSREVCLMLKAIHAQEDRGSARGKSEEVASKLRGSRLDRGRPLCGRRL